MSQQKPTTPTNLLFIIALISNRQMEYQSRSPIMASPWILIWIYSLSTFCRYLLTVIMQHSVTGF